MATNSDGSIVLSVNIDKSNIRSEIKSLTNLIEQSAKAENKTAIQSERLLQAKLRTAQQQEKLLQQQERTKQAVEKTTQAQEKAKQAIGKTGTSATNAQNAFQSLNNFIKIQEDRLKSLKEQYASYILQNDKSSSGAKKLAGDIAKLSNSLAENKAKLDEAKNSANKFDAGIKKVAGNISKSLKTLAVQLGVVFGLRELLRFSNEASKIASLQEANLLRLAEIYGQAGESVYDFTQKNALALGMSKSAAYEAAASYGNLFSSFADGAENAQLTNEMLQTTAVIASKTGRTFDEVFTKIQSGIFGNTRAIDDLGVYVNQATLQYTKAFQTISDGRPWAQLTGNEQKQVLTLAILEQAQARYGNTVLRSTSLVRSQFNAAWRDFTATWGQVVNLILVPALQVATKLLVTITNVLNTLFKLSGKKPDFSSASASAGSMASSVGDTADNVGKVNSGLKEMNEELKKSLADFDELHVITQDTAKNSYGGGGTGGSGGAGVAGGGVGATDGGIGSIINEGEINAKLAALSLVAGAALTGLGIALICTGHWKIGIPMVVAGKVFRDTALISLQNLDQETQTEIAKIAALSGLALLAVGLILLCSGSWAIGFGIIVAGAELLEDAYQLSSQEVKDAIKKAFEDLWPLLKAIAAVCVIVGIVLLFSPFWGAGLALLTLGIGILITNAALKGTDLKTALETFCKDFAPILKAVGVLMCTIGIALIFTLHVLKGLAFILLGITAWALAAGIQDGIFTGETLKQRLQKIAKDTAVLLQGVGIAMAIIGIVVMFTGHMLLGLGMFFLGVSAFQTATNIKDGAFDNTTLKEKIEIVIGTFADTLAQMSLAMFIIGVMMCFINLPLGLGMVAVSGTAFWQAENIAEKNLNATGLKTSFQTVLSDVYTTVKTWVDKINKKLEEIGLRSKTVGDYSFDYGDTELRPAPNRMASVRQITIPKVPALAQGKVIPPNRPFLTVLGDQRQGTNIETQIDTMKQAFEEVLQTSNVGVGDQTIILQLDGREVGRTFGKAIQKEQFRVGANFVKTKLVF